jgi:hypothetical protein
VRGALRLRAATCTTPVAFIDAHRQLRELRERASLPSRRQLTPGEAPALLAGVPHAGGVRGGHGPPPRGCPRGIVRVSGEPGQPQRFRRPLVGPAREHYVLYQLYRHGMLASLAPPGTPTVDVLVLATDQSVVATVQVKTRTYGADGGWHMSEKHENIVEPRCFYAFLDLEPHPPATFIVRAPWWPKCCASPTRPGCPRPAEEDGHIVTIRCAASCPVTRLRSPATLRDGSTSTATAGTFSTVPSTHSPLRRHPATVWIQPWTPRRPLPPAPRGRSAPALPQGRGSVHEGEGCETLFPSAPPVDLEATSHVHHASDEICGSRRQTPVVVRAPRAHSGFPRAVPARDSVDAYTFTAVCSWASTPMLRACLHGARAWKLLRRSFAMSAEMSPMYCVTSAWIVLGRGANVSEVSTDRHMSA